MLDFTLRDFTLCFFKKKKTFLRDFLWWWGDFFLSLLVIGWELEIEDGRVLAALS